MGSNEERMWANFYEKIVLEAEERRARAASGDEVPPRSDHENFIQEEDKRFFENLGTGLAEKVKQQELEESVELPAAPGDEDGGLGEVDEQSGEVLVGARRREELFAEKETQLRGGGEGRTSPGQGSETESEGENRETAVEVIKQSLGINIAELYTALLFITQHQVGYDVADRVTPDEVFGYLQRVFNFDDETHERMLEETRQMEAPQMLLSIEVCEAKELVPKDANGMSDPFCVLYLESAPTRRYTTTVKTETLTPVWQERFEMRLDDAENDTLFIEIWDFDAAETVPEKIGKVKSVKGMRGLYKLAKEIAITATSGNHDNEYIGETRIPLKDIPVTGHEMWYALDKKNRPKRRGLVRLKLAFNSTRDAQVAFQEHRHLLKMLLLHELETQSFGSYTWNQSKWPSTAQIVVLQHGIQRGLIAPQLALAKWIEFAAVQQDHNLDFQVFAELLDGQLIKHLKSNEFSEEEARLFWEATRKYLYSAFSFIRKLRRHSQMVKEVSTKQLISILKVLSMLKSLDVPANVELFTTKLYSWLPAYMLEDGRLSITELLECVVRQAAYEWFEHLEWNNKWSKDTDEDALGSYIKIIQLVRLDLQRAMEVYEKIFIKNLNFPYTKHLYIAYEQRVSDMCMVVVEDICGRLKRIEIDGDGDPELNLGTTLFEFYLSIQRFAGVGLNYCPDEVENMKVHRYFEWFRSGVAHWLEMAVYKAIKRIGRAVDVDNLEPVDSSVQYSSSAVDTLTIFYQIKVFWTQLDWPDPEGSYAFVAKIVDDICKCCLTYVDAMSDKAESLQQKENQGNAVYGNKQFDVSVAWCYAINNIDYIRTSIDPLSKDLGVVKIVEKLSELNTEQEAERCRDTLQLIIDNAKDTVQGKIVNLLEVVAQKMAPAMQRYLMEGAELTDSTSHSMDRLLEYLDSNLMTLHDNLNEENFKRILLIIWEIMADTLAQLVDNNLKRRRPPAFFANLHKTLHTLIQFFNLGADELSNIKVLEKIEKVLKLYSLETDQLVHQFYLDRVKEQNALDDEPYGLLTVKAYFYHNSLNVYIVNARKLKGVDNGSCDSYVKIHLLPEEQFQISKSYKTSVHKETCFPLYDETFSIPLSPEQRNMENALINFEVKDKDFLRTKFLSEAFLPFKDIQETPMQDGFAALEQVHLTLSRPSMHSSEAINVLSRRKGDHQANYFVSKLQSKITPG